MEERFLYSVFPKMPIKNIPGLAAFRSNKSLSLTKDEVRLCLKSGSVYRRFVSEDKSVRVTLSNIDRLHNSKFMTEEEYEEFKQSCVDSNRGQIAMHSSNITESHVKQNELAPLKEDKEDEVETEETVVETNDTNENGSEESKIDSEENVDNAEETVVETEKKKETVHYNNNYNGKRKKK